jgi:PilZ domain
MAQNTARKTDANRRDKPRLRSFMAATVLYNNGQSTLDCVIRNISEDGAKLALPAEVALPDRFDLAVPQRNKTYRATMARRRGGAAARSASAWRMPPSLRRRTPRWTPFCGSASACLRRRSRS